MEISIDNVCSVAGSSQINEPVIPLIKTERDMETCDPLIKTEKDSDDENTNMLLVPLTKSQSDKKCSGDDEKDIPLKRKRKFQSWVFVKKFDNVNQVQEVLNQENTWSIHYSNESDEGKKTFYRCNKVKKRGPQCSAKIYLLYDSKSDAIFMYRTEDDHDHNSKESSEHGLSEIVKMEINRLIDLHLKPKEIMTALSKIEGLKIPKMTQLNNYLGVRRRALYANHTISLGELEQWIKDNSAIPENPHEVFVTAYKILKDEAAFRFVFSSKYLLELARNAKILHVDANHKLAWQGYPVLVVGTTDKQRKFHPLCLAVSTTEQKDDFKLIFRSMKDNIQLIFNSSFEPTILVTANKNIQNAFMEEFENVTFRVCWAHAKKNIQSKVETSVNKSVQKQIMDDIDILHSITNPDAFDKATDFFLKKYEGERTFIAYFKDQWLLQNRNWYLGAAPVSPSTNNALGAFSKIIKDSNILRERFQLSQFFTVAREIVNGWSIKYIQNPGEHFFAKFPLIGLKEWTDSYKWAKLPKEFEVKSFDDANVKNVYQVPAGEANQCVSFEGPPTNFDEFKEQFFNSFTVVLPTNKEEWIQGTCACPSFYEMYICKHTIGLSIRLNYIVPPVEAKDILLGPKKKRDRPSKSKPALIIP